MEEEKQPKSATPPEETANFQGHESDLLFERMNNPTIREQLIALMLKENKEYIASIRSGNWEERPSKSEHPDPDLKLLEDKTTGRIIFAGQLTDEPKTREDIERELDETLAQVSSVTEVSFEPGSPH